MESGAHYYTHHSKLGSILWNSPDKDLKIIIADTNETIMVSYNARPWNSNAQSVKRGRARISCALSLRFLMVSLSFSKKERERDARRSEKNEERRLYTKFYYLLFQVHSYIATHRSTFFAGIMKPHTKEFKNKCVTIHDLNYNTVKSCILFMYDASTLLLEKTDDMLNVMIASQILGIDDFLVRIFNFENIKQNFSTLERYRNETY